MKQRTNLWNQVGIFTMGFVFGMFALTLIYGLRYTEEMPKLNLPKNNTSTIEIPSTLDPRYERAYQNLDAVKEGDYITDSDIIHRCPSKKTCDLGNDDDKDWIVEEITYIYKVLDIVKAKSGDTLVYLFDSETIERWSKSWETLEYLKDSGYRILLEKDRPN